MEVIITKTFLKQYEKCPAQVKEAARDLIDALEKANSLQEINNVKKLSGFQFYYRVRIGHYRVGLKEEKPQVWLFCVMERSQIYKVFPPQ